MRDVLSTHMVVGMADVVHVTDAACARRGRRRARGVFTDLSDRCRGEV